MVSKHNIINGLIRFIENDMAKAEGSITSKMIVLLVKNVLKKNENIVDSLLENPVAKMLLVEKDEKYDLTTLMSILKETANEVGCISLSIPKIPFLLPNGDEIKLSAEDIDIIDGYINEDSKVSEVSEVHSETVAQPIINKVVTANA